MRSMERQQRNESVGLVTSFVALRPRDQIWMLCGLLSALLLAALDHTAIGPALPKIAAEAGALGDYAWVSVPEISANTG